MTLKRGNDKKSRDKRTMRELHRVAYQTLTHVPFDAMLVAAQFSDRHNLNRFSESLPVTWPKTDFVEMIDQEWFSRMFPE